MLEKIKYPIGRQSFESLRRDGCIYVDKTRYIYELVHSGSRTFFLSRPRRFGKSLFLSTLKAYFEGKKYLFEGLDIYSIEKSWDSHPVIHLDLSGAEAYTSEGISTFLHNRLSEYESKNKLPINDHIRSVSDRFGMLIRNLSDRTGKEIVILIDEYDKGIIEVLQNESELISNQRILQPFFSQIKSQEEYIRFCFITGVARFRHYTIFSGFNNPDDISMSSDYAAICGITKNELIANFEIGLKSLSQEYDMSIEDTLYQLQLKYDGYRFSKSETLVFNPFSILNCLKNKEYNNYWLKSGTSKILLEYLEKSDFSITDLEDLWATPESMETTYTEDNPVPLLFQTGYITIQEVKGSTYKLGIPNGEVREALVDELIPKYMGISRKAMPLKLMKLRDKIIVGDVNGFMVELQSLVATIPYQELDLNNLEKTYHLIVYQIFLLLGIETRSEISISGGRIDMVACTNKFVYVMEYKLGGTVEEALNQIESKGYHLTWSSDGRQVIKIGIVFSPTTRTIQGWKII